ncbi:MAG: hypothetical protein JSV66_05380 [Trueperaceae bacterium]|nr:MAG: hypothetical protein JSV66_05380 [Trueperaceae bacterium]
MAIHTQITLDAELHKRAQRKAAAMGISLTEYVRRLVARDLEGLEPEPVDISAVFNLGDSGGSDIARDKDRMLGEAASAG